MVRIPGYDKLGMRKGTWTPEEDNKLKAYIDEHGHSNWRQLPKHAGLARCGKSCRLRWINYLRPDVKRGNYNKEEEDVIIRLHEKLGNRWSVIAARLHGRTDNDIKNYWHTNLKKRCKQNTTSDKTNPNDVPAKSTTSNNETNPNDDFSQRASSNVGEAKNMHFQINKITSDSTISDYLVEDFTETSDSFWTEPFLSEASLVINGEFLPEANSLMSPCPTYGFFDEEVVWQYDDLFSSF